MRTTLIFLILLFSISVHAQVEADCENEPGTKLVAAVEKMSAQAQSDCPNEKKIRNICMFVDGRTEDSESSSGYKYRYQRQIAEASCVSNSDSPEVKQRKIQEMWKKLESKLVCNNLQFDVMNGNIIKYAAATMFDGFINDVASWKVNLNRIDETDGRTVLDYIKDKKDSLKNSDSAKRLDHYYQILRKAGAKHKSEL